TRPRRNFGPRARGDASDAQFDHRSAPGEISGRDLGSLLGPDLSAAGTEHGMDLPVAGRGHAALDRRLSLPRLAVHGQRFPVGPARHRDGGRGTLAALRLRAAGAALREEARSVSRGETMILATTDTIEGRKISAVLGKVRGHTVRARPV